MMSAPPCRALVAVPCAFLLILGRATSAQDAPFHVLDAEIGGPLAAEGATEARLPFVFEGFVVAPDGARVEGAVVVSSAGGEAVTSGTGSFSLATSVPAGAERVRITAVAPGSGSSIASRDVEVAASPGRILVGGLGLEAMTGCSPSWLPTFGSQPGVSGAVTALAVADLGDGPALYAASSTLTAAGGVVVNHVARWDGSNWSPLGSGIGDGPGQPIDALVAFDDGSGEALYAAGGFQVAGGVPVNNVAKWDGASWSPVGGGLSQFVRALQVYDDGTGEALYAGGSFSTPASYIAKWDGTRWGPVGGGMDFTVAALTVFDDGGGAALYAGGYFSRAGGVGARRIARWDGLQWTPLGSGTNGPILALAGFDDGRGPALYAGGEFTSAGAVLASYIAKWDGGAWAAVGTGVDDFVNALAVFDGGAGPELYVGGDFRNPGSRILKWDGTRWFQLGVGTSSSVYSFALFDDGGGEELFVGGGFSVAGGKPAKGIATWDGAGWGVVRVGTNGLSGSVSGLAIHDDGGGAALYAAGGFATAGDGTTVNNVARWDGTSWSPLAGGVDSLVHALAVWDDGAGAALYVAGFFTAADGAPAHRIAKWDGSSWSALGSGLDDEAYALAVFDDGSGDALFAGGRFTIAGGVPAAGVAKWDGTSWSAVGTSLSRVFALASFDDGGGPALYAGGQFIDASGAAVARLDGARWSALVGGSTTVNALLAYDDGSGEALYAAGFFGGVPGVPNNGIARWDGSSWAPVGGGLDGSATAMTSFDDGCGSALIVGGNFLTAGGVAASRIARWDGTSWSPLGSGVNGAISDPIGALATYDDGSGNGPALFVGGGFTSAIDSEDSFLAKWGFHDAPPDLGCPSSVLVRDRETDGPGEVVSFTVTATDDHDPAPRVVCVPPSGTFFAPGVTLVTCTATDAAGRVSTCSFPVVVLAPSSAPARTR